MKQHIEDIQNRVRNHLSPFQTAIEILEMIQNAINDNDQEQFQSLMHYIQKGNLIQNAQKQIDWFISLGAAMDKKIADETFDVEKYIKENQN